MPSAIPLVRQVIESVGRCPDKLVDAPGQLPGRSRSRSLIVDDPEGPSLPGQIEDPVDKIHPFFEAAGLAEESAGPDQEMPFPMIPEKVLARQFGNGVGVQRIGNILLDIGRGLGPVKDIVRAEMDERTAEIPTDKGEVADGRRVDGERLIGMEFALVDPMVGGRVDDAIGSEGRQSPADAVRLGDVEIGIIEGQERVPPQATDEVGSELTVRADDGDLHDRSPL
jgi:hypothetical protein